MNEKEDTNYNRELNILQQADHPFIIEYIEKFPYRDKEDKKETLCIVTKFATGGDF